MPRVPQSGAARGRPGCVESHTASPYPWGVFGYRTTQPRLSPERSQMSSKSWYSNGLRFECTQCGNCCRTHGDYTYVYLIDAEVQRIADHLGLTPERFRKEYCIDDEGWTSLRMDAACPFLQEDNRCAIYPVRPKQCATWPFWDENLVRKTWEGPVKECCPGIDKGKLYPAEEVDRIARETEEWYAD